MHGSQTSLRVRTLKHGQIESKMHSHFGDILTFSYKIKHTLSDGAAMSLVFTLEE